MGRLLFGAALLSTLIFSGIGAPPAGAAAPDNDNLASALAIAFQPYTNVQTNLDATVEAGEPTAFTGCQGDSAAAGTMGHTVWYKYTHEGSPVTLQTDTLGPGTMNAVIRIMTGPASSPTFSALSEVACGDDEWGGSWAAATFAAASGQTYYIQVGDRDGVSPGTFALNISPIISNAGTRFTVNSTGDAGDDTPDGICDSGAGACTLREAIQEANSTIPTDVITFEAGSGDPVTLTPATPLPAFAGAVIDGRTENAFSGSPVVTLDGHNATSGSGSGLSASGSPSSIRGLVIGSYLGDAVLVQSGNNVIQGNYLGLESDGVTAMGNTRGVYVVGVSGTTIGGTTPAARNVVSGNAMGIFIDGLTLNASNNRVMGNYIGTDAAGTAAVANTGDGIFLAGAAPGHAAGNVIGESTAGSLPSGARNVISGNAGDGIQIFGSAASGNTIAGNSIGVNAAGSGALPNSAIGVNITSGASSNTIGGAPAGQANTIAYNAGAGVTVSSATATGNTIRGNSIHDNGGQGIDNTSGGNGEPGHAPPVITATGSASGTACASCTVDVYSDSADEGRVYQGSATADGAGNWSFPGAVVGPNVTATATNAAGSTSEFSSPFACADDDGDAICNSGDNCPTTTNPSQADLDGDLMGDACDTEDDGDGFTDEAEAGTPLCSNAVNDDSFDDAVVNDGCPGGPAQAGTYSEAQFKIGTGSLDPCGNNGWPADLFSQPPFSANKLTVQDITSFLAPVYRMNSNPGEAGFDPRWDLIPGKGILAKFINIQDLVAIIPSSTTTTARPLMFNGQPAYNQTCPYPP